MAKDPAAKTTNASPTSSKEKLAKAKEAPKSPKKEASAEGAKTASTPTDKKKATTPTAEKKATTPTSEKDADKAKKEEAKAKESEKAKKEAEAKKKENGAEAVDKKKENGAGAAADKKGDATDGAAADEGAAAADNLLAPPTLPIRLTYFDGEGRAEIIRLVLAASKADYEDRRIGSEQWKRLKPVTPFSQLPILEYHGQTLGQSLAIARFLASKAGLYGKDETERALIDGIVDYVTDYNNKWLTVFRADSFEEKVHTISDIFVNFIPIFLNNVQELLQKAGGEYFVGGKLSLADLAVFHAMHSFSDPNNAFFSTLPYVDERLGMLDEQFPVLNQHMIRVYTVPEIKGWMTHRPEGLF